MLISNTYVLLRKSISLSCSWRLSSVKLFQNPNYRHFSSNLTKPEKDIIVFKYDKPKFFIYLNIIGTIQYLFWMYFGIFVYRSVPKIPEENTITLIPFYKNFKVKEQKCIDVLAKFSCVFGTAIMMAIITYTFRSVRYLILNKGGQKVSFVTYTPFGRNMIMTVPLKVVNGKVSRSTDRAFTPLKVKGRLFHFLLDNRGEYRQPQLFDMVINVQRNI